LHYVDNLGCGVDLCRRIKQIDLDCDSKVPALSADNIVLVAWGDENGMKIALGDQTGFERLALEDEGTNESRLPAGIEWTGCNVEMVLAGELPVKLARKRRVRVETQVFLQINGCAVTGDGALLGFFFCALAAGAPATPYSPPLPPLLDLPF
jgi:hypothetical protein